MRSVRRVAVAIGAIVGAALYVWFAAVRAVPLIHRRKAARRAERSAS